MSEPSPSAETVRLSLPRPDRPERQAATALLANVVACVLDEALLRRIGEFTWQDSQVLTPPSYDPAVPVNRWERAACHFWDTLFTSEVELGAADRLRLQYLLGDAFKAADRCRAGDICLMMRHSIWEQLWRALGQPDDGVRR